MNIESPRLLNQTNPIVQTIKALVVDARQKFFNGIFPDRIFIVGTILIIRKNIFIRRIAAKTIDRISINSTFGERTHFLSLF